MYHGYFGLDTQAFAIAVNPRYLYMSAQHSEALAHLLYGVNAGGFVMLTGEVGTGKTTIIRHLLEQLPEQADVAFILNPAANAQELLCYICDELKRPYPENPSLKLLTDTLYAFLLDNHSRGRKTLVLIDEAQLLPVETLEHIRLLTNLESNTQKLLQIILVGQPELNDLLAKPALRQLSQRITARYHLRPLNLAETTAYVKHRLKVAGLPPGQALFPPPVLKRLHRISGGIPRLINVLCDRMLLGAFTKDTPLIDAAICQQAAQEVLGMAPEPRLHLSHPLFYGPVLGLGALVAVFLAWRLTTAAVPATPAPVVAAVAASSAAAVSSAPAVASPASEDAFWQSSQHQALGQLLGFLGVEVNNSLYPCWIVDKKGLHCETQKATTWDEFKRFNRPAVLSLSTANRQAGYVALVGMTEKDALLMVNGQLKTFNLDTLGKQWTGEFVFIWRRPEAFEGPVALGSNAPIVSWVAQRFAGLDNQPSPLTNGLFNPALQKRIRIFQRNHHLVEDGLISLPLLLKLNEALRIEQPLDAPPAVPTQG